MDIRTCQDIVNQYPNWHYIGSKRSTATWILQNINSLNLQYNYVLDCFGGSGVMTHLFTSLGKQVWYNDLLSSITSLVEGLLSATSSQIPLYSEIVRLGEKQPEKEYHNLCTQYLSAYFTREESFYLDVALTNLLDIKDRVKQSLLQYTLFQASVLKQGAATFHDNTMNWRKKDTNPSSTWHISFPDLMRQLIDDIAQHVHSKTYHSSTRFSSVSFNKLAELPHFDDVDLIYADPPFASPMSGKFGNYVHAYHILEFFKNYPKNNLQQRKTDTNLFKFQENHELLIENRKWLQPEFISSTFDDLIKISEGKTLVLSYRGESMLGNSELISKINSRFSRVDVFRQAHITDTGKKETYDDLLIIAR